MLGAPLLGLIAQFVQAPLPTHWIPAILVAASGVWLMRDDLRATSSVGFGECPLECRATGMGAKSPVRVGIERLVSEADNPPSSDQD